MLQIATTKCRGWKVVRHYVDVPETFFSTHAVKPLIYKTGVWTQHLKDYGPLCVFDTQDCAKNFTKVNQPDIWAELVIFLCEYESSARRGVWSPGSWLYSIAHLPYGTRFANRVRLLERI